MRSQLVELIDHLFYAKNRYSACALYPDVIECLE